MNSPLPSFLRDTLQTVLVVALVAGLLFAATGVWPPMVAVESESMEPNMYKGDLILVTDPARGTVSAARDPGVVTVDRAGEYTRLGDSGDVIIFDPPGRTGSPIIHRAHFHVEAGENWYLRADDDYLPPGVDSCAELTNCPAPHDGYITKGDHNAAYDQASGIAPPVKSEWILSKARLRIPWLGWVRLVVVGMA